MVGRRSRGAALLALGVAVIAAACVVPDPPPSSTTTTSTESSTTTTSSPPHSGVARLGGARNFLGTGTLSMLGTNFRENVWLAASGGCASKEQGERFTTKSDANHSGGDNPSTSANYLACDPTGTHPIPNTEYGCVVACTATVDPSYYYGISFAPGFAATDVTVEIYSASGSCNGPEGEAGLSNGSTTFQLLEPNADPLTATVAGPALVGGTATTGPSCAWQALHTFLPDPGSTWFVRVTPSTTGMRTNQFGFRVAAGSWSPAAGCSSDPADVDVPYSDVCPQIFGYGTMGTYLNLSGSTFAQPITAIDTEDGGRRLQLDVWDPGEGSRTLQVLDPLGAAVPFDWEVLCSDGTPGSAGNCADEAPSGGWSGVAETFSIQPSCNVVDANPCPGSPTVIDNGIDLLGFTRWSTPTGGSAPECASIPCQWDTSAPAGTTAGGAWNKQPGPYRIANAKYNDRLVRITVDLPADIAAAYGTAKWWSARYRSGGSQVTDRATWSATIVG